jgi:prophage regulatory protein
MSQTIHLQLLPQAGFVRLPQILQIIPVGKSTWWAGIQSGRFPKGVKLGPRTTAWRVEDIRQLLLELGNGDDA